MSRPQGVSAACRMCEDASMHVGFASCMHAGTSSYAVVVAFAVALTSAAGLISLATCVLLGSDQARCWFTIDARMLALLASLRLAGTTSEKEPLPMTTLQSCGMQM